MNENTRPGLCAFKTYENKTTGLRTLEMNQNLGELMEQRVLEDAVKRPRGFRKNARGRYTFKAGLGYDIVDMDLLQGDGTGKARDAFEKKYGPVFVANSWGDLPKSAKRFW